MPVMAAKHALIRQLMADGTRYVFGNPGTTEQGFMDALQDYPEIEFVLGLHEGVALGMADGYARATRRPAFVELHTVPGLGNSLGMLSNAAKGGTPLVIYAGQAPTTAAAQEPVLHGDLVSIARPFCKFAAEAVHPGDVPRLLRRAMKVAAEPPTGPVFLSLPMDVLEAETEVQVRPTTYSRWRTRPDVEAIVEAARMLAASERPALIVGDGVYDSDAQAEVAALAELLGAPIHGSMLSAPLAPPGHPLWAGVLDIRNPVNARATLGDADLMLFVGSRILPAVYRSAPQSLVEDVKLIQIGLNSWELAKNEPVDLPIVADPKAALSELTSAVSDLMSADGRIRARTRGAEVKAELAAATAARTATADPGGPGAISPAAVCAAVAAALPAGAAIFDDGQTTSAPLANYLRPAPGEYFRTRGGGLGAGLPCGIGLSLADRERPVLALSGDGSAMYSISALWTAAHLDLPITFLICNNRSYRVLKLNAAAYFGEALNGREFVACDLVDPPLDFVAMASGMGVPGQTVERPEEIEEALRDAMAGGGPSVVELSVDSAVPGQMPRATAGQAAGA